MSSKKEEERNEKIIRGLMKLPPNRRCINCDSLGPQYVCTNFWTFICISCSGIHREFTHRVKSVSMAKFTSQEVEALQKGGNQRAKEMFLQEWDAQRTKLPASGNVDKIREFIRNVYVDKKYAGGRSLDKPPRDTQSVQNHEDHRRASSYHSFSQSPPYEHQYEDRRSGKQTAVLSRKPGSDRGHYEGKISSFIYSPGRPGEHMYEDIFANDGSGSRSSDYTASSTGDPFRSFGQSPNFQDAGYTSPPSQQVRDILIENAKPQTLHTYAEANMNKDFDGINGSQTTQSSSSYGSLGDTYAANSGSLKDIVSKNGHASESLNAEMAAFSFPHLSTSGHSGNQDLFNVRAVQLTSTSMDTSSDLFAGINSQASSAAPAENKLFAALVSEDVGWATFDLPHHAGPASEAHKGLLPTATVGGEASKESTSTIPFMSNNPQCFPVKKSASHGPSSLITDQWDAGLHDIKPSVDPNNSQFWNAFDAAAGSISQSSSVSLPQNGGMQFPMHTSALGDSSVSLKASEVPFKNGFAKSNIGDNTLGIGLSFDDITGLSFPPPVPPPKGGNSLDRKSSNPFDLLYGGDPEVNNVEAELAFAFDWTLDVVLLLPNEFMDMSPLQEALPNMQLPTTYLDGLSNQWFYQDPITSYIPSVVQGDLAYMARQTPSSQLPNISSQGHVASLGGNPFA